MVKGAAKIRISIGDRLFRRVIPKPHNYRALIRAYAIEYDIVMSTEPFIVFRCRDKWHFRDGDGRNSKPYGSEAAAAAGARAYRDRAKLREAEGALARVYFFKTHIPLTLLRVGLAELGSHRLKEIQLTASQRKQVQLAKAARNLAVCCGQEGGGDREAIRLPSAYQNYEVLFHDLVKLEWDPLLKNLLERCRGLAAAVTPLLADLCDPSVEGSPGWHWVASLFGIGATGVDRQLDDRLMTGGVAAPALVRLAHCRNACPFASHLHLMVHVIREFFPSEITTSDDARAHLIAFFLKSAAEGFELVKHEIQAAGKTVEFLRLCASSPPVLGGDTQPVEIAQRFLGFGAIGCPSDVLRDLLPGVQSTSDSRSRADRRTTGPRTIDYAGGTWSRRSAWDAPPIGAGVLPAQGQTRSPKGHRA